jgi:hypothetical protein
MLFLDSHFRYRCYVSLLMRFLGSLGVAAVSCPFASVVSRLCSADDCGSCHTAGMLPATFVSVSRLLNESFVRCVFQSSHVFSSFLTFGNVCKRIPTTVISSVSWVLLRSLQLMLVNRATLLNASCNVGFFVSLVLVFALFGPVL